MSDQVNEIEFEEEVTPDEEVEVLFEGQEGYEETEEIPSEYQELDKAALIQKIQAEKDRAAEIQKQADAVSAMNASISALGDKLGQPKAPSVPSAPQMTQEDLNKKLAEIRDNFLDDPVKAMDAYQDLKMQPIVQTMEGQNLTHSRNYASLHPDTKDVMDRYSQEVDEIVNSRAQIEKVKNPKIYIEAAKQVQMNHFNEYVQAAAEKILKEKGIETDSSASSSPSSVSFNETINRPSKKKKRVKISKEDAEKLKYIDEDDIKKYYGG